MVSCAARQRHCCSQSSWPCALPEAAAGQAGLDAAASASGWPPGRGAWDPAAAAADGSFDSQAETADAAEHTSGSAAAPVRLTTAAAVASRVGARPQLLLPVLSVISFAFARCWHSADSAMALWMQLSMLRMGCEPSAADRQAAHSAGPELSQPLVLVLPAMLNGCQELEALSAMPLLLLWPLLPLLMEAAGLSAPRPRPNNPK